MKIAPKTFEEFLMYGDGTWEIVSWWTKEDRATKPCFLDRNMFEVRGIGWLIHFLLGVFK